MTSSINHMFTSDLLQLTITNISRVDEGNYTLTATNPAGLNSGTALLSVEAAPEFVQIPMNLQRLQGETAVFNCSATSEPIHSVRWERGGVTIAQFLSPDDQESSVMAFDRLNASQRNVSVTTVSNIQLAGLGDSYGQLTIINTNLVDGQNYSCIVSNVHGTLSATASLTVQVTPGFPDVYPVNANISAGSTITLRCASTGQPEPNVTWYKDGALITTGVETVISFQRTSSNLTLVNVDERNAGLYWCNATNELFVRLETMSPTGLISVHYHPNVTAFNSPTGFVRNQSAFAVFTCSVVGFPLPPIRWSRQGDGEEVISPVNGKFVINQVSDSSSVPGVVHSTLVVLNLTISDAKQYTCTGENNFNVINLLGAVNTERANLSVQLPPRVVAVSSRNSFALWGHSAILHFNESSALPLIGPDSLVWQFQRFGSSSVSTLTDNSQSYIFSENRQRLTINNVQLTHGGRYMLTARNAAGVSTDFINLTVYVSPELQPTQEDVVVSDIGGTVNITCTADGLPEPRVLWKRNDTVIVTENSGTRQRWMVTNVSGRPGFRTQIPTDTFVSSQLVIKQILEADNNTQLTCLAINNFGQSATKIYTLIVEPSLNFCTPNSCSNKGQCHSNPDTQSFLCVCSQGYTGRFCEQAVRFNIPPTITSPPKPVYQAIYTPVNLTCLATGSPNPQIQWFKDGSQLSDRVLPYLYIPELEVQDRGYYHCTATAVYADGTNDTLTSERVVVNIDGVLQYQLSMTFNENDLLQVTDSNTQEKQTIQIFSKINDILSGKEIVENTTILSLMSLNQSSDETNIRVHTLLTLASSHNGSTLLQRQTEAMLNNSGQQFTPNFIVSNLRRYDGCASEPTIFSDSLIWPETDLGQTVSISCPCGDLSLGVGHPSAQRQCTGSFTSGAQWNTANDSSCNFTNSTQQLCNALEMPNIRNALPEFLQLISDGRQLEYMELLLVLTVLETTVTDAATNDSLRATFFDLIEQTADAQASLLTEAQERGNVTARILLVLERLLDLIPLTMDASTLSYTSTSYAVAAQIATIGQSEVVTFSASNSSNLTVGFTALSDTVATITIPESALDSSLGTSAKITHALFTNNKLFSNSQTRGELGSVILASSITGHQAVNNLSEPIRIHFKKNVMAKTDGAITRCVFWDFTDNDNRGNWSSEGCSLGNNTNDSVICSCNHLTHFTLLVDQVPMPVPDFAFTRLVLQSLTTCAFVVSIILTLVTMLTHLLSQKLRQRNDVKLLVNFCCTLTLMYTVYIGSTYATGNTIACIIFSAFFQYMFIATLVAITVDVIDLFARLFRKLSSAYHSLAITITWVLPLLLVLFCVAPGYRFYYNNKVCQPVGIPFYIGFIVPFTIGILSSWLMLLSVIIMTGKIINKSQLKLHYVRTTSLSLIFGIGWAVGLARHNTEGIAGVILDVLFLLTIGLLGVVLFLISCVASSSVRSVWKDKLNNKTHSKQADSLGDISMPKQITHKPVLQFKEPVELESTVSITSEEIVFNQSTFDEHTDLPVAKSPPPDSEEIHPNNESKEFKSPPIDSTEIDLPDSDEETQL